MTFRTTIRADDKTDVASVVFKLKHDAERAGVSAVDVATLTAAVESTLSNLVFRGRNMAGVSTVVNAEKTFINEAYEVKLRFGVGGRRSVLQIVADAVRGR